MKLIALLVALLLERLATQFFRLRDLRWLDQLVDPCLRAMRAVSGIPHWIGAIVIAVVLVLPVIVLRWSIGDALLGIPYVALSVVVLFFSLGPQDIGEEVDAWCDSVEAGDDELSRQLSKALLECDPRPNNSIADAIFVQGNNRIFAVVFWFIVLGPVGAWAVRVADLIRRRALFQAQREIAEDTDSSLSSIADATEFVHALLAWIPVRLSALSYSLAGSFDAAREAWGALPADQPERDLGDSNDALLARVGSAALAFARLPDEEDSVARVRQARAAKRLVIRAVIFWAVAVAALTLFGPAV